MVVIVILELFEQGRFPAKETKQEGSAVKQSAIPLVVEVLRSGCSSREYFERINLAVCFRSSFEKRLIGRGLIYGCVVKFNPCN